MRKMLDNDLNFYKLFKCDTIINILSVSLRNTTKY